MTILTSVGIVVAVGSFVLLGFTGNFLSDSRAQQDRYRRMVREQPVRDGEKEKQELKFFAINRFIRKLGISGVLAGIFLVLVDKLR